MTGLVFGSGGGKKLPQLTTPATTAHILLGREAIDQEGNKLVGTIPSKSGQTYTPDGTMQVITAGQYLAGDQFIGPGYLVAVGTHYPNPSVTPYSLTFATGFRPDYIHLSYAFNTNFPIQYGPGVFRCFYNNNAHDSLCWWINEERQIYQDNDIAWRITDSEFTVTSSNHAFSGWYDYTAIKFPRY